MAVEKEEEDAFSPLVAVDPPPLPFIPSAADALLPHLPGEIWCEILQLAGPAAMHQLHGASRPIAAALDESGCWQAACQALYPHWTRAALRSEPTHGAEGWRRLLRRHGRDDQVLLALRLALRTVATVQREQEGDADEAVHRAVDAPTSVVSWSGAAGAELRWLTAELSNPHLNAQASYCR